MNQNKRPMGIIILMLFFIWFGVSTIGDFMNGSYIDALFLSQYNLAWIAYGIAVILIITAFSLAYSYWIRKKIAYKMSFYFFGADVLYTLIISAMGIGNIELMRDAVVQSRTKRGLAIDDVNTVINPMTLLLSLIGYVLIYSIASWYIYKKRGYFEE